jgi:hypothetical protein
MAGAIAVGMSFASEAVAYTLYTSRAAFNAATGGSLFFESFEADFTAGKAVSFDGGKFSIEETNGSNFVTNDTNEGLQGVTDGTRAARYFDNGFSVGKFTFNPGVSAVGFDLTTSLGIDTINLGGDVSETLSSLVSGVPKFVGLIGAPGELKEITFSTPGNRSGLVFFDAVAYGNANAVEDVPEPLGSLLLLSIGTILSGGAMKRKLASSTKA